MRVFGIGFVLLVALLGTACAGSARKAPGLVAEAERATLIEVFKSQRVLVLKRGEKEIRRFDIELGGSPVGHKVERGDEKTPEGLYSISERKEDSDYHLALRVSYPNTADLAHAKKLDVNAGEDIMVHGTPWYARASKDWTLGCIAVTNKEIEYIFARVARGTPIMIHP